MTGRPLIDVRRLGLSKYEDAHAVQLEVLAQRVADEVPDTLIFTEHEPVVTIGRGSSPGEVAGVDVPIVEVERGGESTYHGPGQLVVYPIIKLPEGRRDLHVYLRDLEEVVIRVLAEVDIEGRRSKGQTGVWIGPRKVCSVGVAVRRWVTWHGVAINVHTDLSAFETFQPCGLDPAVMTRVVDHADVPASTLLFEVLVIKHFCEVFGLELPPAPPPPDAGPTYDPNLPVLG